jgi:hypothetical protein
VVVKGSLELAAGMPSDDDVFEVITIILNVDDAEWIQHGVEQPQ